MANRMLFNLIGLPAQCKHRRSQAIQEFHWETWHKIYLKIEISKLLESNIVFLYFKHQYCGKNSVSSMKNYLFNVRAKSFYCLKKVNNSLCAVTLS